MKPSVEPNLDLLQLQIELEESNYKYAVELQKDFNTLKRLRENIGVLKQTLDNLLAKDDENGTPANTSAGYPV